MADEVLSELRAIADPVARGRRATKLIDEYTELIAAISGIRQEVIEDLRGQMSPAELAKALGLTRARVSQLLRNAPAPERSFLGTGPLTVVVGQKRGVLDRPAPGGDQGEPVVAGETVTAFTRLAQLAKSYQLD